MSKKNFIFKQVMTAVKKQRRPLFFLSCFVNILLLVTAIYMLQIYDRVLTSGSLDTLMWLTLIALFAITIYGVLEQSRRLILARSARFLESQLNTTVLRRHMEVRLSGSPVLATVRDVTDLRNYYQSDAALAFMDLPWSAVFILFIWGLHPALGAIALLGAVALFIAALLNDRLTRKDQNAAAGQARAAVDEAINLTESGETISPLGMAPTMFARLKERQDRVRNKQQSLGEITTTVLSFTRSLRMGLQIIILGAGAYFVLAGQITPGAMIAASIILARALAPIERSTAAWNRFVSARTARTKLERLFADIDKLDEPLELPRPKAHLSVEKLVYLPPGTRKPILEGVSFDLPAGQVCSIVGLSGAGKSTLCRLLVGAWTPTSGAVRLDGASVHKWGAEALGQYIGYLPQTVEMFPGTVAENISRFRGCEDAEVIQACKVAGVHDMILALPESYSTRVGGDGYRMSAGERQRICLARAVFGNPAFVVLDEPNSNLDRAGDEALLRTIAELKKQGTTVVVVSHRAGVLRASDKIVLLADGRLVKVGDVSEFLRSPVTGGDDIGGFGKTVVPVSPKASGK